jgi:hypothetical protein
MTNDTEPLIDQTRRYLLSPEGLRRYQAYDLADKRQPRTLQEHRAIVAANFKDETDGQEN